MNALSHHIECLLLTHNCVVVPQFGAFLTMACPSSRVEAEELFFPPLRQVRFSRELTEDDGLLVESVRTAQHVSSTEAKRQVQKMVLDLRSQLLAEGQADFGSLGIFTQDDDGYMSFQACQAGAVTPEYFGLDAFTMPLLSALRETARNVRPSGPATRQPDDDGHHITIRISRSALRQVAAAAAILVMGFLLTMSEGEPAGHSSQASILPTAAAEHMAPAPAATPKPLPHPQVRQPQAAPAPAAEAEVEPQDEPPATPETGETAVGGQYCIVLASCVSDKNAQHYVADLQQRGHANARILKTKKMNRVVLDGFDSEADAYTQKSELNKQGKEFAEAWVLKL